MSNTMQLTEDDGPHIERLKALRQMGTHNMFTELKAGLKDHFGESGVETYEWVTDHFEFFQSAKWRDLEPEDLPTEVEV